MLALYWAGGLLVLWLFVSVEVLRLTALSFLAFSVLWFVWVVLEWYIERFIVTTRRVLLISGVLTRKVAIMPLVKVTDLTFEQTLSGRTLDYGTFIFETAGQQQALSRVEFLPQPNQRYRDVSKLLFGTQADVDPEDVMFSRNTQPVPYVPREG